MRSRRARLRPRELVLVDQQAVLPLGVVTRPLRCGHVVRTDLAEPVASEEMRGAPLRRAGEHGREPASTCLLEEAGEKPRSHTFPREPVDGVERDDLADVVFEIGLAEKRADAREMAG